MGRVVTTIADEDDRREVVVAKAKDVGERRSRSSPRDRTYGVA
jgi:hypothetical protein